MGGLEPQQWKTEEMTFFFSFFNKNDKMTTLLYLKWKQTQRFLCNRPKKRLSLFYFQKTLDLHGCVHCDCVRDCSLKGLVHTALALLNSVQSVPALSVKTGGAHGCLNAQHGLCFDKSCGVTLWGRDGRMFYSLHEWRIFLIRWPPKKCDPLVYNVG